MFLVLRTARTMVVMTSALKPPIVAMPIHSLPGSSTTASFVVPELAEFEAMDLDAQLEKLEKLSSTPSKSKSKAMDEAVKRALATACFPAKSLLRVSILLASKPSNSSSIA
ncbi:unnamed protein product [Prunus armeniaca]